MKFLKLLLIRHAQSIGNLQKRMQGNSAFDLSAEGKQQAAKLAQRLWAENWLPSAVYSSPIKRAAQTTDLLLLPFLAQPSPAPVSDLPVRDLTVSDLTEAPPPDRQNSLAAIQPAPAIAVEYADELREFQNSIFEGLTWNEAKQQYPELCDRLERSPEWIQIPGAESLADARDRSRRFLQKVLDRHQNGDRIWVITHSWILQHLIGELMGCDRSWRIQSRNTALFEFWVDRSRWHYSDQNRFNTDLWQIRRFNDAQHLKGMLPTRAPTSAAASAPTGLLTSAETSTQTSAETSAETSIRPPIADPQL